MKQKVLLSIASAMIVCSLALVFTLRGSNKQDREFFEANVEALAAGESGGYSECYNNYTFDLLDRVLRCGDCTYVWGKGNSIGGYCIF